MRSKKTRALVVLTATGLSLAGCQTYERDPLNLEEHRQAWLDRSADSGAVLAFADRLDEADAPAERFDPSDGITLREGETIALVYNADLRLARARAQVAAATAENAGLWEDPVFQIDVLRITESVANPWVISPGLALTIPLSGRLGAEKDRADAALRGELYRVAEAEQDIRTKLRRAWASWSADRLRLEETEAFSVHLQSLVGSTEQLARAGELMRTEATLFVLEHARQRSELPRLHNEIAEGEARIRSLLGLAPTAGIELLPGFGPAARLITSAADAAEQSLALARLREEYEVAEQTLRREILKQYPDLTIGPAYEDDQGQSRIGFLGAIPIPILNANRQGIAEAQAQRALARATFETEYERIVSDLTTLQSRLDALRRQREEIEQIVVPLVDRQLEDARQLMQLGEAGVLVLLESLTHGHQTKLQLIDLRLRETFAEAEIKRLTDSPPDVSAADRGEVMP